MSTESASLAPRVLPTSITSLPFTISAPGSYVLDGNLTYTDSSLNAITIASSDVLVDFRGFTVTSTTTTDARVVFVDNVSNIEIRNGNFINFNYGVLYATRINNLTLANLNMKTSVLASALGMDGAGYLYLNNVTVFYIHNVVARGSVMGTLMYVSFSYDGTISDVDARDLDGTGLFEVIPVYFLACGNVKLYSVLVKNLIGSIADGVYASGCTNLTISDVVIQNLVCVPPTPDSYILINGIQIDNSNGVHISNVRVSDLLSFCDICAGVNLLLCDRVTVKSFTCNNVRITSSKAESPLTSAVGLFAARVTNMSVESSCVTRLSASGSSQSYTLGFALEDVSNVALRQCSVSGAQTGFGFMYYARYTNPTACSIRNIVYESCGADKVTRAAFDLFQHVNASLLQCCGPFVLYTDEADTRTFTVTPCNNVSPSETVVIPNVVSDIVVTPPVRACALSDCGCLFGCVPKASTCGL